MSTKNKPSEKKSQKAKRTKKEKAQKHEEEQSTDEEIEQSKEENIERSPFDHTHELHPDERRMDSLAVMLAAQSICVATAVISGKIYIAANELHATHTESKKESAISSIYEYFNNLARNPLISHIQPNYQAYRLRNFQEIGSKSRLQQIVKPSLFIRDDLYAEVAKKVVNHTHGRVDLHSAMREAKHEAEAFGILYGHYTILYRHFKKLEDSLTHKGSAPTETEKREDSLNGNQLAALSHHSVILKRELRAGVHAEMQILAYILDNLDKIHKENIPREIYIGISKLCCLNCHIVLDVANSVFEKRRIPIKLNFRGAHDRSFLKRRKEKEAREDSWICPTTLSEGYNATTKKIEEEEEEEIAYEIGKLSRKKIDKLREMPQPAGPMTAEGSDSDTSSQGDSELTIYKEKLEDYQRFLKSRKVETQTTLLLKEISTVLDIYKIEAFTSLWSARKLDTEQLLRSQSTILERYNLIHPEAKLTKQALIAILQDPIYVGEKLSKRFMDVNLPPSTPTAPSSSSSSSSIPTSFSTRKTPRSEMKEEESIEEMTANVLEKKPKNALTEAGMFKFGSKAEKRLNTQATDLLRQCNKLITDIMGQENSSYKQQALNYDLALNTYRDTSKFFTLQDIKEIQKILNCLQKVIPSQSDSPSLS
jgi:hypothetical protein